MSIENGVHQLGVVTPGNAVVWVQNNLVKDSGGVLVPTGPQAANNFFAGPPSGAPAIPTFRAMVAQDINGISGITLPNLNTPVLFLGGLTSAFPSLQRVGAQAQFLLADGSDFASIQAKNITANGDVFGVNGNFTGTVTAANTSIAGTLTFPDGSTWTATGPTIFATSQMKFGGNTAAFPMLKRTATALNLRLGDDSADAPFTAGAGTFSGNGQFAKVGIGMAAVNPLDITASAANAPALGKILNANAGNAATAEWQAANGTNTMRLVQLGEAFAGAGVLAAGYGGFIGTKGLFLNSAATFPILFGVGAGAGTEKMRLDANGVLCINAAAAAGGGKLYVAGISAFGTGAPATINDTGVFISTNSGVGVAQNVAFGITNTFGIRGFISTDYCEVSAAGNLVRLAAPGGGGGNWTVVSERAKKKDLVALPGDPFVIINGHAIEIGRYITDPDDSPLHAFLFYEDAITLYPYATVTMPERILHDDRTGEDKIDPAFKGLSQEAYVPLLMRAMQLVDQRLKAGGL